MSSAALNTMPVVFIGHGSPMNALADNEYTKSLNQLGQYLPRPQAILVVSAHWLTEGSFITSTEQPKVIYDFYGFPEKLYQVHYPAQGSVAAAIKIHSLVENTRLRFDNGEWGLDHGSWSILKHIYPAADIPVLQLSLDIRKSTEEHFQLAQELQKLRELGILIIGSGNVVHNLREISWQENAPAFSWADEFDSWVKQRLEARDFKSLISGFRESPSGQLSVPTLDHYLPMLYTIGASRPEDRLSFIYNQIQNASISMLSFLFEK